MPGDKIVIAGPCSAESREGLVACARALGGVRGVTALRAGAWKPRTLPGGFEGEGSRALPWLREAREATGLMCGTEVATPDHVMLAAPYVDFMWIGARTASDPFAMQALADTIGRVCADKPVLVKNPLNPDLPLWIGALQRLYAAGVRRLGAIHRGFSVWDSAPYRNAPLWEIPLQLHKRFPSLTLLHDPSHTAGKRSLLPELSQTAMDLGFDGLMIECHQDPASAKSDGGQQITPPALASLLDSLTLRSDSGDAESLQALRLQVDETDRQLLSLLSRRMALTDKIGHQKKALNLTALQPERYRLLTERLLTSGRDLGLDPSFLRSILEAIHGESLRRQLRILNKDS